MDASLIDDLRTRLASDRVSTDATVRSLHAHDWWPRPIMQRRAGTTLPEPEAVVRPRTRDEVVTTLRWSMEHGIGVVPYGAGTGVCGGALPVSGAVTLDLKGLNRIGELDEVSGTVTVEPGVTGQSLEDHLAHRGWTLGHFPSSIHASTIGGFLAVRSAGQASAFYGKLEDTVVGLEVVLADGTVVTYAPRPQSAAGPDLVRLFLGGEGTTGIITSATLRIWPRPDVAVDRGLLFPDIPSALGACREFLRTGLRPHVYRLYDEADTALVFGSQGLEVPRFDADHQGCLCIIGAEGTESVARFVGETARRIMIDHGAHDLGAGPGEHWRAHRHDVSYRFADYVKPGGAFGDAVMLDTMEVAAVWSRLVPLYEAVRAALDQHCDLVLAHFSHVYPEGSSIYFTLGAVNDGDEERALARYDAAWEAGMRATLEAGGTTTHHHGVGLLRAPWLAEDLGGGGWEVLGRVKRALDPQGLLNPGKLGLGGPL